MPGPNLWLPFMLSAVAAYLIGSVSFSIIITQLFVKTDVREHGSGNAGATNVLRTAGKLPAILTFAGDFFKCFAAICFSLLIFRFFGNVSGGSFFAGLFGQPSMEVTFIKFVAGLFCMVGHIYPVYFGFRGGKGVVSTCAIILLINWQVFLVSISLFILMVLVTRIVSLSVLTAAVALPVSACVFSLSQASSFTLANTLLALAMCVILFITHRKNIGRLIRGTEPRFAGRKKGDGSNG